jgi:hypothetical protein
MNKPKAPRFGKFEFTMRPIPSQVSLSADWPRLSERRNGKVKSFSFTDRPEQQFVAFPPKNPGIVEIEDTATNPKATGVQIEIKNRKRINELCSII